MVNRQRIPSYQTFWIAPILIILGLRELQIPMLTRWQPRVRILYITFLPPGNHGEILPVLPGLRKLVAMAALGSVNW